MNLAMRLFRRSNGIWYVELDRENRLSLKTRDKVLAQKLYRQLKREYLTKNIAILEGRPPEKTISDFTAEYLEYSEKTKARSTVRSDSLALRKLEEHFGGKTRLSQIKRLDIDRFIADLGQKAQKTSVAIWYRHLKSAFTKAVEWGYVKDNPFKGVKEPRGYDKLPRYLKPTDIQAILATEADPAFSRLWRFYLYTGCRRSEALQITWRDVDFEARCIFVLRTKNRRPKVLRITPDLMAILKEIPHRIGRLFPFTPDYVSHHFAKTAGKAGIKARVHDLRHTFASYLRMAGVELETVQELLGHDDIKATRIYAHLAPEHLDEALAKLKIADKSRTPNK